MVLIEIAVVVLIILLVPLTLFWLIMLIDSIKTNKEKREMWIAICFLWFVGAAVYYITIFQKQRKALKQPDFSLIGINKFLNSIPKLIINAPQDQQIAWYCLLIGTFLLIVDVS